MQPEKDPKTKQMMRKYNTNIRRNKMKYSTKAQSLTPSLTLAITAKAKELKDKGLDVVGFGAGEPDFNTPQNIIDAATKAMNEGKTKYTPASGINELKDAVAEKLLAENGLKYAREQVIISTGGKQCLANAFEALLNDGDEVLIATPYWVSYPDLVTLSGGKSVFLDTKEENSYKITVEVLKAQVTDKSKVLVINSPNNPTGTIYSREELVEIAEFCREKDLFIISDEMYEKLIYGDEQHVSIASLSDDAYARTLVVGGFSKSYAMTGWRLGYAAGPKDLVKLMGSIQSHTTSNPTSFVQYAAVEALKGSQDSISNMNAEFAKRRDYMVERTMGIDGLSCIYPKGAFYVMMDVRKLMGKTYKGKTVKDSLDFSAFLLEDYLVAVVPGVAFGLEGFVRLSYATSMANIGKGFDRISEFVSLFE
jgi:aspartate aminotransferase